MADRLPGGFDRLDSGMLPQFGWLVASEAASRVAG